MEEWETKIGKRMIQWAKIKKWAKNNRLVDRKPIGDHMHKIQTQRHKQINKNSVE